MLSTYTGRLKKYLRENRGAPFIVCFIALLLICAPLSMKDKWKPVGNTWILLSDLAEVVAVLAYLMLVVSVILQLVSYLRHDWRGTGEPEEASSNNRSSGVGVASFNHQTSEPGFFTS